MKICFLLQRRFAYVGHKMAVILKEKYGVTKFCGYVYTRKSFEFLQNQTDIKYTSLLLDEEIHKSYPAEKIDWEYLNGLEKEYGIPNFWPFIFIDRVVMHNQLVREYPYDKSPYTSEEIIKIFQTKAKAVINFLDQEKPDAIFLTIVGSIGSMLLYHIAKKRNIQIIFGSETRINDGYTLSDNYQNFSWADSLFDQIAAGQKKNGKKEAAREYIYQFRQNPKTYSFSLVEHLHKDSRLRQLKWLLPKYFWWSLCWFIKLCFISLFGKKRDNCEEQPIGFLADKLKRKARMLIGFNHLYDDLDLKENFAFYPLQYEPEVAVSLFAPFWTDQINLIKQIAKSLPLNFKLYVKEHPMMVGYRTHAYYRELKKLPNVKLMNPNTNSYEIIAKAKLITVISGTIGWEAALLKKPVITFGDIYYNKLSMVKKCAEIEKLPYLIKEALENFQYDEEELKNFIGAIIAESADVGLMKIWREKTDARTEKEKLTLLIDLIAKKLNLTSVN